MQDGFENKENGFVLVAVIWLAGLIAVLSTAFALHVRTQSLMSTYYIKSSNAEFIADGMVRLVAWRLADGQPFSVSGTSQSCMWRKRHHVSFAIQDQGGLADLNVMPEEFFTELLRRLGEPSDRAVSMARAIGDFRDVDTLTSTGANEPVLYDGFGFGPKNAPFETVAELDQIPGMSDQLYAKLVPLVTVHAASTGIDPLAAPKILREVFSEKETGEFEKFLSGFTGAQQGRAFRIKADVTTETGGRFVRSAMVIILRQPDKPFAIVEWTREATDEGNSSRAKNAGAPCFSS
jgi:general secretion pathway protein K